MFKFGHIKFAFLLLLVVNRAPAVELEICYNYSCASRAKVIFLQDQMDGLKKLFINVVNAQQEREAISKAIGLLMTFSGQQTPTWRDKGGNYNDDEVDGRMDCIDHSTNTTAYLKLLEREGWFKFHKVREIVSRSRYVLDYHRSAQIAEVANDQRYAVDSWFFDNGHPAVIYTLEEWKNGASPND
jgi:hypothetical protein